MLQSLNSFQSFIKYFTLLIIFILTQVYRLRHSPLIGPWYTGPISQSRSYLMKQSKSGIFKASNLEFNPSTLKATSYGWWAFVHVQESKRILRNAKAKARRDAKKVGF